jgi:formate hydrogenlyase transcriptional activator
MRTLLYVFLEKNGRRSADVSAARRRGIMAPVTDDTSQTLAPDSATTDEKVQFESLVADLSARFVNLPADQVDAEIEGAQRRIVEALDLDRSTLFELLPDRSTMVFTHYWAQPGFAEPPKRVDLHEHFPWCASQLLQRRIVSYTSLSELPADCHDIKSLSRIGSTSLVSVPLEVGGEVVGILNFGTLGRQRQWAPEVRNRFKLIAQVFAGALARKRADLELRAALTEVEQLRDRLRDENEYLRREVVSLHGTGQIVGHSQNLKGVLLRAQQVAATDATVLLLGETGTGKELLAAQIHDLSARRGRLMVRVNCAAIPAALLESELFGREKGAYTGALSRQIGRFEMADHSTIFLDEIGDLPLEMQVKLLRVLQEKTFERLGSSQTLQADVRIIAATNRDLESAVAAGTFREDLYYRLNVFPIRLPPLRERAEDLPAIVWTFVEEFAKAFKKPIESISKSNMEALQAHPWPGNIRELRNVVERAVIVATGPRLTIELPQVSRLQARLQRESGSLDDVEREHIRGVLEKTGWRIRGPRGAAVVLDLKPTTLEARMAKLGLRRPTQ